MEEGFAATKYLDRGAWSADKPHTPTHSHQAFLEVDAFDAADDLPGPRRQEVGRRRRCRTKERDVVITLGSGDNIEIRFGLA